jgi:HSP20 family protein
VHEDDDKIYVEAELPGFRREDIDVSLQNDVLTIRAEREEKKQSHTQHLHERRYRRIHRRFTLPAPVDDETCDANYRDGVLHLEMTKHEDSKKRKIEIK